MSNEIRPKFPNIDDTKKSKWLGPVASTSRDILVSPTFFWFESRNVFS